MSFYGGITNQLHLDNARIGRRGGEARAEAANRRRDLMASDPRTETSIEALACPACARRYDFGAECVDCGTALVGESFVGVPGVVTESPSAGSKLAEGLLFGMAGMGAVTLIAIAWIAWNTYVPTWF